MNFETFVSMQITNQGSIQLNVDLSFQNAISVEDYPKFAEGYLESKIIDISNNHPIILRSANLNGQEFSWKTELKEMQDNLKSKKIIFEQIDGPLSGMNVQWELIADSQNQTSLKIIHKLEEEKHPKSPEVKQFFQEHLPKIADRFIENFKNWCEHETHHSDLNQTIKNLLFLATQCITAANISYADVHKGPFMKNTFKNLDFKGLLQNEWSVHTYNFIFHGIFKISKSIKRFVDRYGVDFPVYGLLSQTVAYQNLTNAFIDFVKANRKNSVSHGKLLTTLEIHTGTGNASAQYLISNLNQGIWIITDREPHNFKHIGKSLEANKISFESLYKSSRHATNANVLMGILDLVRLPENFLAFAMCDEIIAHMGAYFGNQTQTLLAFKKMHRLLKPGGMIYLAGYTHPHIQKEARIEFLKSNFKSSNLIQTIKTQNALLTWLFVIYVKLTTRQWQKDIESNNLHLLNRERLKAICNETGFNLIGSTDLTKTANFGKENSLICAYALQKI